MLHSRFPVLFCIAVFAALTSAIGIKSAAAEPPPPPHYDAIVVATADDGSGASFKTLQAAIAAAPSHATKPWRIAQTWRTVASVETCPCQSSQSSKIRHRQECPCYP